MFRRLPLFMAAYVPQTAAAAPNFEIHRLSENPDEGSLTRVSYVKQRGQIVISRFPQLGERKEDPTDNSPQYDVSRRSVARFQLRDIGKMLAVLDGRMKETDVSNQFASLKASRDESGGFELSGSFYSGPRQDRKDAPFKVQFDHKRTTQLYHFFEEAVKDSLGFSESVQHNSERGARSGDNNNRDRRNNNRDRDNNRRQGGSSSGSSSTPRAAAEDSEF